MLWDQLQVYRGLKPTFFPTPDATTQPAKKDAKNATIPSAGPNKATQIGGEPETQLISPVGPKQKVTLISDLLKLTFDADGGVVVKSEFIKQLDKETTPKPLILLDDNEKSVYYAPTGLTKLIAFPGVKFPSHETRMTIIPGKRELESGEDRVSISFESPTLGGLKLIKTYIVKRGSYAVDVKHEVINIGQVGISPWIYLKLVRHGTPPPGESSFYSTFTGPVIYTEEKKYEKTDFTDIDKKEKEKKAVDVPQRSQNGYIAMVQHYFASAWLLPKGESREFEMGKEAENRYFVMMTTPVGELAPGASKTISSQLFIGPQEEHLLESLSPGLELVKDYGWLTILAKPLYWLLFKLHSLIGNWGWAIVCLVLLLKAAFYWLNAKAYSSMAKMKAINPKITEMRERLKSNPQQMQVEMMRIYKEEKVNPLGGCFPIMIQIPVFIALYWVLLSSVEMRNAPWILWIHDLSEKDPWFILPVIMTLTTVLQTSLNPAPPDPLQAKLMWFMPLAFSVMFFAFPAGLVIYWITNNILSIAQQWVINTRMGVPPKFHLPKF